MKPRFASFLLAAVHLSLAACADIGTAPQAGPAAPQLDQSSSPTTYARSHTLHGRRGSLFLDDKTFEIRDDKGHKRRLAPETYARVNTLFARFGSADAVLEAVTNQPSFRSCVMAGVTARRSVRVEAHSMSRVTTPSLVGVERSTPSLTVGAAPSAWEYSDPLFCQNVSMAINQLTSQYNDMKEQWLDFLSNSAAGGVEVGVDGFFFDARGVLTVAGQTQLNWLGYKTAVLFTQLNILVNQFYLGGCNNMTYDRPPTVGGGNQNDCHVEEVTIEATDSNGNWYVWWKGYATVCGF